MKRLQIFALLLMAALVCISAGPVSGSVEEPSSSSTLPPNTTQLPDSGQHNSSSIQRIFRLDSPFNGGCIVSTCFNHNLADRLQTGDETAGSSTKDSNGFGKK